MHEFRATFFDGKSAVAHSVGLRLNAGGLRLRGDGTPHLAQDWRYADIVANAPLRPGWNAVLHSKAHGDAVLQVEDPDFVAALLAAAPRLRNAHLRDGDSLYRPGWWAVALPLLALVMLVALGPELLVRAYPDGAKARLGRMAVSSLVSGAPVCGGQDGMTALAGLVKRLRGGRDGAGPVTVSVIDDGGINAFAAPGGHLVVTSGLIDVLRHPGELAFVLAHELSHLDHEDALRAMVRERGVTATLRALAGGSQTASALAGGLLNMAHSRRVEERADRDALKMIFAAGVTPGDLRGLFERLTHDDMKGDELEFIRTHPVSTNRQKLLQFRQEELGEHYGVSDGALSPALDGQMWQAVKDVCGNRR